MKGNVSSSLQRLICGINKNRSYKFADLLRNQFFKKKRLRETMILMFRLNAFSQFSKQFSPNVSGEPVRWRMEIQSEILESEISDFHESEVWTKVKVLV